MRDHARHSIPSSDPWIEQSVGRENQMKSQLRQVEAMRNPMAATLANACFRKQTVRPTKGKGSFRRADKHKGRAWA